MQPERLFWQVCFDHQGVWSCVEACASEQHAKAALKNAGPDAFLVKVTLTRLEPPLSKRAPRLRAVPGGKDEHESLR